VLTDVGPVEGKVPRDTSGTFEPQIVKKRQRRMTGVDEMVLSLSAKGPHLRRSPNRTAQESHPLTGMAFRPLHRHCAALTGC
jgi:Transposase, Mutator family